jgi:two-component system chemotaxis response regulator CheY
MGKTVIVVDDSKTARAQVRHVLEEAGYEVVEAANGREGLTKLTEHPETALVICDVNMPVMGGLEMLERIRTDKLAARFLMLTTEADPSLHRRALQAGVSGWIVKPFNPAMLVRTLRGLLPGT